MEGIIIFYNEDLIKKIREGDLNAKEDLVLANSGMIYNIVHKYDYICENNYDRQDLLQAGNLGLIEALERYDPKYGTKFITFAYYYIKGEVQKVCESLLHRDKPVSTFKIFNSEFDYLESTQDILDYLKNENEYSVNNSDFDEIDNKILIDNLLNKVTFEQKIIIENRYYKGLSQKETGKILEKSQVYVSREEKKVREIFSLSLRKLDCTI